MALASSGQTVSVLAAGLYNPNKIVDKIVATGNVLIVSEAGTTLRNTGRISIINQLTGSRRTLVSGLPSAVSYLGGPAGDPDGPSGLALAGQKLYVTIGIGDAVVPGPGQGLESPNPAGATSPLFDSVLEITLPQSPDSFADEYAMTAADQATLAATGSVSLPNLSGPTLLVRLIANLPDYQLAPRLGNRSNVKAPHLYGIETFGGRAYVIDSGLNLIHSVDIATGNTSVLTVFPDRPNPLFPALGGPFVEAVPDAIHRVGNKLLVPLLTGFPFTSGTAEVRSIDLVDGSTQGLIPGLTSAIDVLQVETAEDSRLGCVTRNNPIPECLSIDGGRNSYYTLEFSTFLLGSGPGRLRFYRTLTSTPVDISTTLVTPASMARN